MSRQVLNHPGVNKEVLERLASSEILHVKDMFDLWVAECKKVATQVASEAARQECSLPAGWTDDALGVFETPEDAHGIVHLKLRDWSRGGGGGGAGDRHRTIASVRGTKLANLKRSYERVGHAREEEGVALHRARVLTRVAVMLLRYEALVQAKICCGMQGAIPPAVAEALSDNFGASHECFASPLNHHYQDYFSAFPDIDRWFGSHGSFFESYPKEGSFECNPPFAGLTAQQIGNHIDRLLRSTDRPLSFTVFVPKQTYEVYYVMNARGKGPGAEAVDMSRWHTHTMQLDVKSQWYISGDNHTMRLNDERACWDSTIDTFVLWWQNEAGRQRWPVTKKGIEELRFAFMNKPRGVIETAGASGSVAQKAAAAAEGISFGTAARVGAGAGAGAGAAAAQKRSRRRHEEKSAEEEEREKQAALQRMQERAARKDAEFRRAQEEKRDRAARKESEYNRRAREESPPLPRRRGGDLPEFRSP